MEPPRYLQILWSYKWLVILGALVAAGCGLLSGYSLSGGKLESRATFAYSAGTTVLLGSDDQRIFRAELPGQAVQEGTTASQRVDLTNNASLYAYLISGDEIKAKVEDKLGKFRDADSLTAVRRTTSPGGNEAFPGRQSLPIVEIIGLSDSSERAEEISRTANTDFQAYVTAQQNADAVPDNQRVDLSTIAMEDAEQLPGSNPLIPVILTFLGVFLAFVVLIFLIHSGRQSRANPRSRRSGSTPNSSTRSSSTFAVDERPAIAPTDDDRLEPVPAGGGQRARAASRSSRR